MTNNNVKSVVSKIERLCWTLHAVTNDRNSFILQYLESLLYRNLVPRDDFLINLAQAEPLFDATDFVLEQFVAPDRLADAREALADRLETILLPAPI